MSNAKNLKKNFVWNTVGTALNAFNSLFFLIIVTRINGINDAGVFTFAFSMACLLFVIGLYSGRAYQVTENDKKISDNDYFYAKIITCLLMLVFAVIYCVLKRYNIDKTAIIMFLVIYKMLEAFSDFLYAIVQKKDNLYKVGISLFYKSIFSLLLFLIVDLITKNLLISELFIILSNIIIIIIYDIPNVKKDNFKIGKFNSSNVKRLLKAGFYTFGFSFLTIYLVNASKYALDGLVANKYQTIFGVILMPATILSLFAQFVIQPFILKMKNYLEGDYKKFKLLILKLIVAIFFIGLFTIVVTYFLGVPILQILYGLNLEAYLNDLLLIMVGSVLYSFTMVISVALTTMRHTLSQLIAYVCTSIFAFIYARYAIINMKILGASLCYVYSMIFLFILYLIILFISLKKHKES